MFVTEGILKMLFLYWIWFQLVGFGKLKIRLYEMFYIVTHLFQRTDLIGQLKLTRQVLMLYKWVRKVGFEAFLAMVLFCLNFSPSYLLVEWIFIFPKTENKSLTTSHTPPCQCDVYHSHVPRLTTQHLCKSVHMLLPQLAEWRWCAVEPDGWTRPAVVRSEPCLPVPWSPWAQHPSDSGYSRPYGTYRSFSGGNTIQ